MTDLTIVQQIAVSAVPLIFAITLHEVAHGYAASLLGDQTAKLSGRLSLNPLKHIDPIGTVAVPFLMLLMSKFQLVFGWAKPVPIDARNLHHPRRDLALVALAGPVSNLLMALFWGAISKAGLMLDHQGNFWFGEPLSYMGWAGVMMNVVIGVLNLVPLPPLDGGKVFAAILPPRAAYTYNQIEPYGFFILIALMLTGWLFKIIAPFIYLIINGIGSLYGLY